jgi:hypothetical protein
MTTPSTPIESVNVQSPPYWDHACMPPAATSATYMITTNIEKAFVG